jgi:hypothetical protein
MSEANIAMFDCWALNCISLLWRRVPLHGALLAGRTGARAAKSGDELFVFGGFSDPDYFADLHAINVETGEVRLLQTTGECPSARSTPIVVIRHSNLYVWGGFNGDWPSELFVLNLATLIWCKYPQNVTGRTAMPFVLDDNVVWSYGSSKNPGMLRIDLDCNVIAIEPTSGAEPPSVVMASQMVRVNSYAFFFGGRANSKWTLMYACSLRTMWWFVFHLTADGKTVSATDGSLSDLGLFMLPRIHSFSMCYVPESRHIVAFLGQPEIEPPPLFVVSIGEAMGVINLRDDMREIFALTQ